VKINLPWHRAQAPGPEREGTGHQEPKARE
jgi:hypothetical protein